MYQAVTKRLTDLLSNYLDFDQNKLHLGLWRGDLEIHNVNLKNEGISPILNIWKQHQNKDLETKKNEQQQTQHHHPSILSFLTKDLLLSSNPSRLSHLDVKLINGSIKFFRAVVPWKSMAKSMLLGSRDSKVKIELKGVTIRLGLESCITKALENDEHGLWGACTCSSNMQNDDQNDHNGDGRDSNNFHSKDDLKHAQFREWKQNAIDVAEKKLAAKEDVPLSVFESSNDKKNYHNHDTEQQNSQQDHNSIENAFIERFVRSFASNLGWRVGKSFEATVEDLKIILIHDDIEVGFINKSISVYEFNDVQGVDNNQNEEGNKTSSATNESDFCNDDNYNDNNEEREVKKKRIDEIGPEAEVSAIQNNIIRKSIKMLGSGLFVRKVDLFIHDNQAIYIDDPPSLDEHILLPTDVDIVMTLRRDGNETSLKVEKDTTDEEQTSFQSPSTFELDQIETFDANEMVNATHQRKRRRGKRDKSKDINFFLDDASQSLYNESLGTDNSDYVTVNSRQQKLPGNSYERIALDEPWKKEIYSSEDESSPQFSFQVAISAITFVLSTKNCLLLRNFSTKTNQLLIGRPETQIPTLCSLNAAGTALDSDFRESVNSIEGSKYIVGQWWSYALFNAVKLVKTKKYRVQELGPRKVRFNVLEQKRLKREYVALYSRVCQQKTSGDNDITSKSGFNFELEEKLLILEDKLSVEQILLFREFSRKVDAQDVLEFTTFDTVPFALKHPLISTSEGFNFGIDEIDHQSSKFFNVGRAPPSTHRRHKSLFTMENTKMNDDTKHRRGLTLAHDSMIGIGKPLGRGMQEVNFGLHASPGTIKPTQHINMFSSIQEEEDYDQAFQGNISSIVTVSIKSIHLFVCDRVKLKSNSIPTEFDEVDGKDLANYNDINSYDIAKGINVVLIYNEPHEVILSSVLHQTRMHWETQTKRDIQVMGIEGLCCKIGSSFISSGTLRCLNTGFTSCKNNQNKISVESLPHHPFYIKDNTKENFFCCELQTCIEETSKKKGDSQDSVRIQTLIAKIHVTIACDRISRIVEFIRAAGFFNQSQHYNFPSSKFDDARLYVLEQTNRLRNKSNRTTAMNLLLELNGVELKLFTDSDTQFWQPGLNDSKCCNISLDINDISLRQGSFLDKYDAMSGFFHTFPNAQYKNSLCTLSELKVMASSHVVLDEVQGIDVLCSELKRFGPAGRRDLCKFSTSVNMFKMKVKLSKERVQVLSKIAQSLQVAISDGTMNESETGDYEISLNYPRLRDLARFSLQRMRITCPVVDISIVDDKNYQDENKRRVLFEGILLNLLQYEVKFGSDLKKYETRVVSQNIATKRLQGMGIPCCRAKEIIGLSIDQLHGLQIGDAIPRSDKAWQVAMSRLISNMYNDCFSQECEKEIRLISFTFGVRFYLEQLVYDWRMSISMSSLTLKNVTGVSLVKITESTGAVADEQTLEENDECDSAISIKIIKTESGFVYGEGGLATTAIYADDVKLKVYSESARFENNLFVSTGLCECLCLDEEILQLTEIVTDIFTHDSKHCIEEPRPISKPSITSTTLSGEIAKMNALFCTNNYIPFMEISLYFATFDILSNHMLYEEGKSLLITAGSNVANIIDLSFEGRRCDQFMSDKKIHTKESSGSSFGLKVAIPSDPKSIPMEFLLTFKAKRLIVLRRFINDMLQYILTPDYGLGRILNEFYKEGEEGRHPVWFQIHFNDCSILLPKNSDSSDLVAITASKIVLANGFEEDSWRTPTAHVYSTNAGVHQGGKKCYELSDDKSFHASLIPRMTVTVENANIYTGISTNRLMKEMNYSTIFFGVDSFIDYNEVIDNGKVFSICTEDSRYPSLNELTERVWEKVTSQSLFLEVVSDFLPSRLRVLIRDFCPHLNNNNKQGLDLNLRTSQFYTILSTWYENMQELPVLFPYSDNFIHINATAPTLEPDWPEYGTDSFIKRMLCQSGKNFEIAVCFSKIQWHCKFDNPQFFPKIFKSSLIMDSNKDGIIFTLEYFIMQVDFDNDGVMRAGIGATAFAIQDKRISQTCFEQAFGINAGKIPIDKTGSINMTWGLDCGRVISSEELDFPFQVSILMTPDRWCLVNLGMEELESCTTDISCIWILQEYFSSYFVDGAFGNPYFTEKEISDDILRESFDVNIKDEECLNIDLRLWLLKPCVRIMSTPFDLSAPSFVLKSAESGLFYRFKTIGLDFTTQEVYAKNLDLMRLKHSDMSDMNFRHLYTSGNTVTMLVRSLNLEINYDYNAKSNHTDIHVDLSQPFQCKKQNEGIEFPRKKVLPIQIPLPKICKPIVTPSYDLGAISCAIDLMSPEYFTMAFESLLKFTGPSLEEEDSNTDRTMKETNNNVQSDDSDETSFSVFVDISGLKVFISDPLLGVHMPILVVNIPNLHLNCSQLQAVETMATGISDPSDLQACIDAHLWIDYYKSEPTRSWEPLMEPYQCKVLFEKSISRGQGITISSECPLHINLSGAFLETVAFAAQSFAPYVLKLLRMEDEHIESKGTKEQDHNHINQENAKDSVEHAAIVKELHNRMEIYHKKIPITSQSESAAFSLTNLTGDQIRYHQQQSHVSTKLINYLPHRRSAALDFPATRSLVLNLNIVEIPVFKNGEEVYNEISAGRLDSSNYIDVQIPGFNWSRSVPVDIIGKRFVGLKPKSPTLQLKIAKDWRLANALSILTDVSFYEGRRQVTITSSFELLNKTTHEIQLASHIDPTHKINSNLTNQSPTHSLVNASDEKLRISDCSLQVINPGETVQLPILLLESALQQDGKNLGSFWLRPQDQDRNNFIHSLEIPGLKADEASIGFCSNPMHIAQIVDESALMFKESGGNILGSESFSSGYQLSCPIVEKDKENISPFCYCIEVKRSPLVAPFVGHDISSSQHNDENEDQHCYSFQKSDQEDRTRSAQETNDDSSLQTSSKNALISPSGLKSPTIDTSNEIHGPVAYSLEIHPPIIIENFLPEKARYELMHAIRKKIVWSGELMPGDSIPVYTVSLDAPLLLLIHLGYCRTPVGEGALVHHGSSDRNTIIASKDDLFTTRLNPDRVINTFTGWQLSAEERAGMRLGRVQENDKIGRRIVDNKRVKDGKRDVGKRTEGDELFHEVYSIHDIATETTVVDHLGQKLNLYIENKLGGGGQRRITIYCPYWIVNTTDHALRYKQEKTSMFVSGTMTKDSKDGSRFVDFRESVLSKVSAISTIFPGKPGALSCSNVSVNEFAKLIEKEMPLQQTASMAFMFNFRDFLSIGGYERKLCIQLADPNGGSKYCSDWSNGVSLESVGVSQTISMHCMDGRHLEIAMTTRAAPGRLSAYTKIVRLTPKYVLVNHLEKPIRLWQDSSLMHPSRTFDGFKDSNRNNREPRHWSEKSKDFNDVVRKYDFLFGSVAQLDYRKGTKMRRGTVADKSALYITTAGKGELIPFHLPDTKVDRELRIDLGRKWNLTASFPSDVISDHTFKLTPVVDLRILNHVDNRAAPRYVVQLPPHDGFDESNLHTWDGELGLWFETIQWGRDTKIVVKGTKRGKYSINNTDIHPGDELIQIDETPVSQMSFSDTMKLLKERLSEVLEMYRSTRLRSIQNSKKTGAPRAKKPKFLQRFEKYTQDNVDGQPKAKETLKLVFQTLEHRMKKLRGKASARKNVSTRRRGNALTSRVRADSGNHKEIFRTNQNDSIRLATRRQKDEDEDIQLKEEFIQVSMKHLNQSIFVFVHKVNLSIPYKIENRSLNYVLHFRQRACEHHQWNVLLPGDSLDYCWEEPMKPQKLLIRVGAKKHRKVVKDNQRNVKHSLPFHIIDSEDHAGFGALRILKLDEIGYTTSLPCPIISESTKHQNDLCFSFLHCQINAEGKTKKLVVSDNRNGSVSDELKQLESHMENLRFQMLEEKQKHEALFHLKQRSMSDTPCDKMNENERKSENSYTSGGLPTVEEEEIVIQSNEADTFVSDVEAMASVNGIEQEVITTADSIDEDIIISRHQVLVEIVEAAGLRLPVSDAGHSCNPYCTVRVIRRNKKHRANLFALKSDNVKRTYYINQSYSPKWSGMKFIFDISPEAELDPQDFSIIVKVKDFRFVGKNGSLGMTEIRLHNLKHQKEVFGWYPLMARTGRGSEILAASAEGGRGSVKLRVQWIYSVSSLIDYYLLLSQKRLAELSANFDGMKHQLENLKKDEEVEKEMREILNRSSISIMNKKTNKMLHTSSTRPTSKQGGIFSRRSRQKDPVNDLSTKFDGESPRPPEARSSTSQVNLELQSNSVIYREVEDSSFGSKDVSEHQTLFTQDEIGCLEKSRIFDVEVSPLPPTISSMKSWLQASILLNINYVRQLYHCDQKPMPKHKSSMRNTEHFMTVPYPTLVAPTTAPKIVQKRKREFLDALHRSRENFEKAAQRSLRAVSNPGGWLRIRPITALYLPSNGYTGMYVKLRYGSEAIVSRTVPTPVNPEWYHEYHQEYAGNSHTEKNWRKGNNGIKSRTTGDFENDNSVYFSSRCNDNDLEINVQALKTAGSLQLSVVGVKAHSKKEELGVLHIQLADAICCCTENFDDDDDDGSMGYVRWFPLTDPKWTESVDVDIIDSHMSVLTEEKHSDVFSMNYTKCIKLAMWWEKDQQNTLHISNPDDDASKSRNYTESYFDANLNGISAAIIDSFKAKELLSIAFTNIDVRALITKPKTWLGFALGNVQIDHHHDDALEPVVLSPTPVMHPQPTIQFLAERDNINSKSNIDSFRHIAIQVEELDLRIEENWVFDLWDVYAHLIKKYHARKKSITRSTAGKLSPHVETHNFSEGFNEKIYDPQHTGEIIEAITQSQRDKQDLEAEDKVLKKIYIDELMLGCVKLNITYTKSLRNKPCATAHANYNGKKSNLMTNHRRAEIFRLWSELGHDEDWTASSAGKSTSIPEAVFSVFPAISAAPVRVSGKALNNVFETWSELIVTLKNFYSREIIYQFYNIIGSLDVVGNPIMVVNSLLKGARDFVVIPLQEFLRSPKDPSRLGIGVAKGTLSLFSQFFSVFGFFSNLSESLGSGVATLSLDEYFKRWHAEQAADQARNRNLATRGKTHAIIASAVTRPIQDIIVGIYFGTTGIIVEPYVGARAEGINGFARGLVIGGIGILTKPIVGFLDALSHASGSIYDAAKNINIFDKKLKPVSKRRFPYTFGCNNILQPYDATDARSADLLKLFPMEKDMGECDDEVLVTSEMLLLYAGEATYIVVTTKRIILFEVQTNGTAPPTRLWQNDLNDDVKILSSLENFRHSGYVLRLKRLETKTTRSADKSFEKKEHSEALVDYKHAEMSPTKNVQKYQEKNFKTIYEQAGSLLPNVAFITKNDYRNPAYVEVLGEFQHSKELTRVHNAICCLTKQFDSVIHNAKNTKEGCTSFKSMHFVDESILGKRFRTYSKEEKLHDIFSHQLEHIPWMRFGDKEYSTDIQATRRTWKFSNELEVSKMQGGPSWIIEARARSSFVPMEFPPIPPTLQSTSRVQLRIDELKGQLKGGEISFNECEIELSRLNFLSKDDIFASAHEFPSMKNEHNSFKIEVLEEGNDEHTFKNEETEEENDNEISQSFESNDDSFVKVPVGSDIQHAGIESITTVQEEEDIEANLSQPHSRTITSDSAEQRLIHVEQMLRKLMNQMNEQSSVNQIHHSSVIQDPPIRSSGISMVSALTNSENIVDGGTLKRNDTRDREQLLQEIEDLKRQISYLHQNPPNYIDALNETESTSIGVIRQKQKKRKRKLLKKPWK